MALHWLKNLFLCNALNTYECPLLNGLLLYALSHAHPSKAGTPRKVMSAGLGNYIWGPLCTLEFLSFRATIEPSFLQFICKATEAPRGEATCLRTHRGRTGIRIQASCSISSCIFPPNLHAPHFSHTCNTPTPHLHYCLLHAFPLNQFTFKTKMFLSKENRSVCGKSHYSPK